MTSGSSTAASFREKVAFMKNWRPENAPSNRDRMELFALHKQAVSGDAPANPPPNDAGVSDKTKYQAWKAKRGLAQDEAMTQYIAECDRQVRVYGTVMNDAANSTSTPQTPTNTPRTSTTPTSMATPRGLAAIPLLCAAAAESRVAYLRRMEVTTTDTSWWSRQEPLCSTPGTAGALPESLLLGFAACMERFSLGGGGGAVVRLIPPSVLQSLLWPLHNMLLSVWMAMILILLLVQAAWHVVTTLVWGARRTGRTLSQIWESELQPTARAVHSLCEPHQPLSVRLMGLLLLPLESVTNWSVLLLPEGSVGASVLYAFLLACTWWYWLITVPWIVSMLTCAAAMSGMCFAVIEFAGV